MDKIIQEVKNYLKNKTTKWEKGKDCIQYAGPYFTEEEYIAAIKTLLNGWLILGEKGKEFEQRFPNYLGKNKGILTNSGSSANLLAMKLLTSKKTFNLPKNTKVITPVAGFPTTVNGILECGFEPVFIDINIPSLNLNIEQLESVPNGSVLIFAHALGNPANMDLISKIVKQKKLILIEDCCDALGSSYDNKLVGSFGEIATCSFFPAHHITMGEGGFVATDSDKLTSVARSFRDWGRGCFCHGKQEALTKDGKCKNRFSNWLDDLPNEIFDHKYIYDEIGFNLKPIEIQAAIGLEQLNKLPEIKKIRIQNFKKLYNIFSKYKDSFYLPVKEPKSDPNWFVFPLTIRENAKFNRNKICYFLEEHKIQTRPYFAGNLLLHPAYKHLRPNAVKDFPIATYVTINTFFLGVSPNLTEEKINYIEEIVTKFFKTL